MMSDTKDVCACPSSLAMASVPMQEWCEPYDFETALTEGTIFPCLNLEFYDAEKELILYHNFFHSINKCQHIYFSWHFHPSFTHIFTYKNTIQTIPFYLLINPIQQII